MSLQPCFVISPIGKEGSEIRKRADQVLKHIIKPAADKCGFEAQRADEISEPGLITSQAIQRILNDPLVIADLTGMNPNVFYELAIRHCIKKPLVQIINKGEKIPFDVADMRTIHVDHTDLDSAEDARKQIEKQINAIKDKSPEEIETPVSFSLNIQSLSHSGRSEERSIAELINIVTSLQQDITSIKSALLEQEDSKKLTIGLDKENYFKWLLNTKVRFDEYNKNESTIYETLNRLNKYLLKSDDKNEFGDKIELESIKQNLTKILKDSKE